MSAAYTPRPGSLPSMVIGYLQNHPTAELTLEEITDKFSASRGSIHSNLAQACDHKLLARDMNKEDEWVYKAGPALTAAKPGLDMDAVHKTKRTASRATTTVLPDPAAVEIETDVPLPGRRAKIDWTPLLTRLEVNHSAKLPLAAKHTLSQAMAAAHKAKQGEFTLRTFPDTNELRVWRVA